MYCTKIKDDAKKVFDTLFSRSTLSVYTCGNGGSAAIANHMAVDWCKNSNGRINAVSLANNAAMITMIANDYGFDEVFSKQLEYTKVTYEIVVLVSSSGNSPNIIKAALKAKERKHIVIGFTGFDGGKLRELSDVSVHLDSKDYGTVEDFHSNVMHEVARLLKGVK